MSGAAAIAGDLAIPVRGEYLHLLPQRALWWGRRRTLIVADLHLGKEEAFLELGVAMPQGVLGETLARLDELVGLLHPARLVVLGDLVHGPAGMSDEVVEAVAEWRTRFDGDIDLVPGNHDELVRSLPASWRVDRLARAVLDPPFVHLHEARPRTGGFAWGGHLHPVVRLAGRLDRVLLPCFVVGSRRGILPAFTLFSRGVRVVAEAGDRIYAVADGAVVDVSEFAGPV